MVAAEGQDTISTADANDETAFCKEDAYGAGLGFHDCCQTRRHEQRSHGGLNSPSEMVSHIVLPLEIGVSIGISP